MHKPIESKVCRRCNGSGKLLTKTCPLCKGTGKPVIKPCLRCERLISLEHEHIRICPSCKQNTPYSREPMKVVLG
jgi:RecJ-like exonuclease